MNKKSSYEDLQEHIRSLKTPEIEVFRNKYPDREYSIHLNISECTCICPKTGLPDFAVIAIDYAPARDCIELKSFKEYIHAFRNIGIFHEHVVNRILDDFVAAARPRSVKIEGVFNARGGIQTTVRAEYKAQNN